MNLTWVMFAFALVRDILRPAPCEQELHDWAFPLPLVTKLPVPASPPFPVFQSKVSALQKEEPRNAFHTATPETPDTIALYARFSSWYSGKLL